VKTFTLASLIAFHALCGFAQDLPEQYREKFSESFPIRKEQHLELKAYADRILAEGIQKSLASFNPDFSSIEKYKSSLSPYRKNVLQFFGCPPPGAIEGRINKFEKTGEDVYANIYRVWIEVMPGVHAYGIYMVPKKIRGKAPLIIAQHGGGGNPEAIVDFDTRVNYHSFGHEAVKKGYIVWAPALTMLSGYANDPEIDGVSRELLDRKLRMAGTSIIGVEIHKIIESTKALLRSRPEIDADRIGMTGLSWGGFFTMYTAAVWPAIKVAVPSAYFRDSEAVLQGAVADDAKMPPDRFLFQGTGHFQAIGLICPRPCMVQLGENDTLFDMEGARKEAARSAVYYEKLGIRHKFEFDTHPGGHEFENESIFRFFQKHL
jgi:dienelactone hydrolase